MEHHLHSSTTSDEQNPGLNPKGVNIKSQSCQKWKSSLTIKPTKNIQEIKKSNAI